jgi:hypothetical protein
MSLAKYKKLMNKITVWIAGNSYKILQNLFIRQSAAKPLRSGRFNDYRKYNQKEIFWWINE